MRGRRRYRAQRRPRSPPSASIAPVAQHRGGNAQLACELAQRPTAAHQQGYRFLLELIRKMTPSLAHSTPFRSRRSLAKVSTNSGEPQPPTHPRSGTVNLSGRVSRMQATGSGHWGLLQTHAADFGPDPEFLGPGSSMLCGSDVIAAEVEVVIDLIVG